MWGNEVKIFHKKVCWLEKRKLSKNTKNSFWAQSLIIYATLLWNHKKVISSVLFCFNMAQTWFAKKTADTQHFRVFITAFLHVKTESNINWDHLLVMENFLQNRSAKNKKNLMKTSGLVATKLCFEYLENLCRSWLDFNLMPSVTSICFYEIIQQQVWFKFSPGHIPVNSCNCYKNLKSKKRAKYWFVPWRGWSCSWQLITTPSLVKYYCSKGSIEISY